MKDKPATFPVIEESIFDYISGLLAIRCPGVNKAPPQRTFVHPYLWLRYNESDFDFGYVMVDVDIQKIHFVLMPGSLSCQWHTFDLVEPDCFEQLVQHIVDYIADNYG